ncbi:MAG: MFS transporter [Actinomycetaceae bacterium]|nr:MFS transporter [Actinomycetaceae bacterium]
MAEKKLQKLFIVCALLTITIVALTALSLTTIAPLIASDLQAGSIFPLIFGLPAAAQVVSTVVAGIYVDAKGTRAPLLQGVAFLFFSIVLSGLAPNISTFLVARTLDGIGNGFTLVSLYVLVTHILDEGMQARGIAAFSYAWVIPSFGGPFLAGIIADAWQWRAIFWILAIGFLPVILFCMRLIPNLTTKDGAFTPNRRLIWASVAGAGIVMLQVGAHATFAPFYIFLGAVLGIVGIGILLPTGTLRARPGIPALLGSRGLINGAFISAEAFIPLLLQHGRHWSTAMSGILICIGAATWAIGSAIAARVQKHQQALPLAGISLCTLGLFLTLFTSWNGTPIWFLVLGWTLAGLGVGLAYPIIALLLLRAAPENRKGEVSSQMQVADAMGMALLMGFISAIYASVAHLPQPWQYLPVLGLSFIAAFLSAICALRGKTHRRQYQL